MKLSWKYKLNQSSAVSIDISQHIQIDRYPVTYDDYYKIFFFIFFFFSLVVEHPVNVEIEQVLIVSFSYMQRSYSIVNKNYLR